MFLGIEIGGTKLQLVVAEVPNQIVDRCRLRVDPAKGAEGIRAQIESAIPGLVQQWNPSAIGVGFGGPVDWRTGVVGCSHQIGGWSGFPLGTWLGEMSGLPVPVENDANCAACGEGLYGAGRDANPVFWINMGSGVGGGLFVDGSIYHGLTPGEAEVGHLRLDKCGTLVEERCSGWAVDRMIREVNQREPDSILATLCRVEPGCEARHLAAAVSQRDPEASRILEQVSDDLAFALSHVTQLFHPERIVVGGGLALVGEPLRAAIAARLPRYVMDSFQPGPQVVLAQLMEDAVPVGALAVAKGEPK